MHIIVMRLRRGIETLIALVLFSMVALTFADVIGRRIIGRPIYGAHDITEHLMALAVFAGLPLVTAACLHLTVDLFDRVLMKSWMRWWRVLAGLIVATIFALLAWLFFRQGMTAGQISEVSQALRIPRGPVYFYMSASCALSALAAALTAFTGPVPTDLDTAEDAT
ncbi:MAG: TRAP transporter small permease [Rhodobacteraceae bacterium]|nr:MAG: TRAP transporter small permease [Paracoccaceae bacterium]